jgi:hypothetical protein
MLVTNVMPELCDYRRVGSLENNQLPVGARCKCQRAAKHHHTMTPDQGKTAGGAPSGMDCNGDGGIAGCQSLLMRVSAHVSPKVLDLIHRGVEFGIMPSVLRVARSGRVARVTVSAVNRPSIVPAQAGAVNQQAVAIGHSQWCRDHGDAWRAQLRLAALASSDQNTQKRLNSTRIAQRRPWWWRRWPAERKHIPFKHNPTA